MINTLFLTTVAVEPTFVAFLQHSQTHFHGLQHQFFQISLKNSEFKSTHSTSTSFRIVACIFSDNLSRNYLRSGSIQLFLFRFENYIPAGKAKRRNEHRLVIVCIRPNFSGSRQRECMRTAQIGPDLRLFSKQLYMLADVGQKKLIGIQFSALQYKSRVLMGLTVSYQTA